MLFNAQSTAKVISERPAVGIANILFDVIHYVFRLVAENALEKQALTRLRVYVSVAGDARMTII